MFNFRKKPIITVTFDPYHNLPMMQAKNCTEEQIRDAVLFMQGHVRIDSKRPPRRSNKRRRKKENRIHKFFRILSIIIFDDRKMPTVEERIEKAAPKSARAMLPARLV